MARVVQRVSWPSQPPGRLWPPADPAGEGPPCRWPHHGVPDPPEDHLWPCDLTIVFPVFDTPSAASTMTAPVGPNRI